jgi:copper chaperone
MTPMKTLRTALTLLALTLAACDGRGASSVVLRYQVDGMHCDGCVAAITEKVTAVDGVTGCQVDLQTRSAEVRVRDAGTGPTVQKAIERLGYTVKPLATAAP